MSDVPSYDLPSTNLETKEVRDGIAKLVRRAFREQSETSHEYLYGDGWNWEIRYEKGSVYLTDYHDIYKNTWTDPPDQSHLLWWCTRGRDFHPDTWANAPEKPNRKQLQEGAVETILANLKEALEYDAEKKMDEARRREALAIPQET